VEVARAVERIVEKPVYVEKIIEREIENIIEKRIEVPIERIVEVPVEVIIERPVARTRIVEEEVIVERAAESHIEGPTTEELVEVEDEDLARAIRHNNDLIN
jgi:hypothetical protein